MSTRNKKRKKSTKYFVYLKNQMRGPIARGSLKDTVSLLGQFRKAIPTRYYPSLIQWMNGYPQAKLKLFSPTKVDRYKDLRIRPVLSETDLESTLLWWAYFIKQNSKKVNVHLRYVEEINRYTLLGDNEEALKTLSEYENRVGKSMWFIQAKIALQQESYGTDFQRKYQSEIRDSSPGSIASYVAYHASSRNSDAIPAEVFLDRFQNSQASQSN